MLAEAAAELLDAGELEPAAEAEVLLADLLMINQGRREEAAAHFEHAASLLAGASALALEGARPGERGPSFRLAVDEAEEAVRRRRARPCRWRTSSGLDELRAHTLSTLGFSRVMTGDLEGLRDLRESVEVAAAANSPQAARGYNNLASITADLGDLPRAFELYAESRRVAERFGDALALRWLNVERMYELYWRGDWDGALEIGEALLAESDEGPATLHELDVLLVRAKIALGARGRGAGAWRTRSGHSSLRAPSALRRFSSRCWPSMRTRWRRAGRSAEAGDARTSCSTCGSTRGEASRWPPSGSPTSPSR